MPIELCCSRFESQLLSSSTPYFFILGLLAGQFKTPLLAKTSYRLWQRNRPTHICQSLQP